jgi:hypothetical protein
MLTSDLSPIEIEDLSSIEEVLADVDARLFFGPALFWRGHADFSWKLTAEVFREVPGGGWYDEPGLLSHFMAQAESRHPRCPPPKDLAAWLMLARHYGLPTRILDWSYNPLVALYFAAQAPEDVDGCLWALAPEWMNMQQGRPAELLPLEDSAVNSLIDLAFRLDPREPYARMATFGGGAQHLAIRTREIDPRILAQQGAFTIHHAHQEDLADVPYDSPAIIWRAAFRVPKAAKPTLRYRLASLSIRKSTLFPDLAALAEDLKKRLFFCPIQAPFRSKPRSRRQGGRRRVDTLFSARRRDLLN